MKTDRLLEIINRLDRDALGQEVEFAAANAYQVDQVFDIDGSLLGLYNSSGYNNGGTPYWWPQYIRWVTASLPTTSAAAITRCSCTRM